MVSAVVSNNSRSPVAESKLCLLASKLITGSALLGVGAGIDGARSEGMVSFWVRITRSTAFSAPHRYMEAAALNEKRIIRSHLVRADNSSLLDDDPAEPFGGVSSFLLNDIVILYSIRLFVCL